MSAMSAVLLTYVCKLKVKRSYKKRTLPLHFMDNITCSLVRVTLLSFVLVYSSLWSEAQPLGGLFFGKWCFYSLEGLQLGYGLCFFMIL
jgi:hypothetical protein